MKIVLINAIRERNDSNPAKLPCKKDYRILGETSISRIIQNLSHCKIKFEPHSPYPTDYSCNQRTSRLNEIDERSDFACFSSRVELPSHPIEVSGMIGRGIEHILETTSSIDCGSRFRQVPGNETFGFSAEPPQAETSLFRQQPLYGMAKSYTYTVIHAYRCQYGLFVCSAAHYNIGNPRFAYSFVAIRATAALKLCIGKPLLLSALDARRDWRHAKDNVNVVQRIYGMDHAGRLYRSNQHRAPHQGSMQHCSRPRRARLSGLRAGQQLGTQSLKSPAANGNT